MLVGGGPIAEAKLRILLRLGAKVIVIAPAISENIILFQEEYKTSLTLIPKKFSWKLIPHVDFLVLATSDSNFNKTLYYQAQKKKIVTNVVDNTEFCDFIFPAIVRRKNITIAIGTNGRLPELSAWIRRVIERIFPHAVDKNIDDLIKIKNKVRRLITKNNHIGKHTIWNTLLSKIHSEKINRLNLSWIHKNIINSLPTLKEPVKVFLVGAGSGDARHLTMEVVDLLAGAEIVVYDSLVPRSVLDLVRRDAKFIFVGKRAYFHSKTQEEIHQILKQYIDEGINVVRLKGGDVSLFSRAGEEIDFLRKHHIDYQIMPGISSFQLAAARLKIPMTQRGIADGVQLLSGHDIDKFLHSNHFSSDKTLAIYMGYKNLKKIVIGLLTYGYALNTGVALIMNIGLENEKTIITSLIEIKKNLPYVYVSSPLMILIGNIINQHFELNTNALNNGVRVKEYPHIP